MENSYDAPDGLEIILYVPGVLNSVKSPCLTFDSADLSYESSPYAPTNIVSSVFASTILNFSSSLDVTITVFVSSGL